MIRYVVLRSYKAGDVVMIKPQNTAEVVQEFILLLRLNPEDVFTLKQNDPGAVNDCCLCMWYDCKSWVLLLKLHTYRKCYFSKSTEILCPYLQALSHIVCVCLHGCVHAFIRTYICVYIRMHTCMYCTLYVMYVCMYSNTQMSGHTVLT